MEHNYASVSEIDQKKSRNSNYCSAPQCSQYAEKGISMHLFPKDPKLKVAWEAALKMGKPASSSMRICSRHFLPTDYFPGSSNNVRHKLKPNAVPTQNLPVRKHDKPDCASSKALKVTRADRAQRRHDRKVSSGSCQMTREVSPPPDNEVHEDNASDNVFKPVSNIGIQVCLADYRRNRPNDNSGLADILCGATEKCTQVNLLPKCSEEIPAVSVKSFTLCDILNEKSLFTFTGIHSLELLDTLVSCVEELASDSTTNKKILPVRERVLLTMVKIKDNMSFSALGLLFGVCGQTSANYFKNMCPLLATVLKSVIPFPDQELIRCNLPKSFKNFKHTRIVLDCAETTIEKCKCLKCRVLTYSQYTWGVTR